MNLHVPLSHVKIGHPLHRLGQRLGNLFILRVHALSPLPSKTKSVMENLTPYSELWNSEVTFLKVLSLFCHKIHLPNTASCFWAQSSVAVLPLASSHSAPGPTGATLPREHEEVTLGAGDTALPCRRTKQGLRVCD